MKFFRSILLPIAGLATMAMLFGCGRSANPAAPEPVLDTTPPPAPSNLSLSSDASGHPVLTWTESAAPDLAGYQVYVYSAVPGGGNDFVLAADTDNTDNLFLLPSLIVSEAATYAVRAVDTSGNLSAFSASADIVIPAPGGGGDRTPIEYQ